MNKYDFKKEYIKLFVCDFDGIFTDGKLVVYSDGRTSKTIDYRDIMAIANLLKNDIKFAIISGEKSVAIDILKEKFPSIDVFQNERKKIDILKKLSEKYAINNENILYMGDDINDIACLSIVGYPVTVINAHDKVKELPNIYITKNHGGSGAVREVTDCIL
jgi:3-deoxy-D-manno-octulosonate 8-phosphate phosphatase (KDO 8-P phosphatase)